MPLFNYTFHLPTAGFNDVQDISPQARQALGQSGLQQGLLTVMVPGSTGAVTTIEFEPGAVEDFKDALGRIAPEGMTYAHDQAWGDGNGFSHVRAALVGPSCSVPFIDGELQLGTWQQLVLVDCDNGPRRRRFQIQVMGE